MPVAIECRYRPGGAQDRLAIRHVHLEFMIANKARVMAGGPSTQGGELVGMFLLLSTDDPVEAEDFLAREPYARAGLFAEIRKTCFAGYLPEPREDFLNGLLEDAMAASAGSRDDKGNPG